MFYVGIGLRSRHLSKNNRTRAWSNYVNKYGFIPIVIEDSLSVEEAKSKERHYIKLYGRKDTGTGVLLNMTDGGEGSFGALRSMDTKLKMSIAAKNRKEKTLSNSHKNNISISLSGRKHTIIHRKNNSISKIQAHFDNPNMGLKGKRHSEESKRKIGLSNKFKLKGRKLSEDVKLKMSLSRIGKKLSEETKKKIGEANKRNRSLP